MAAHGLFAQDMQELVRATCLRISEELPRIVTDLLVKATDPVGVPLRLEFKLSTLQIPQDNHAQTLEKVYIDLDPVAKATGDQQVHDGDAPRSPQGSTAMARSSDKPHHPGQPTRSRSESDPDEESLSRLGKRRATGGLRIGGLGSANEHLESSFNTVTRQLESNNRIFPQRRKKLSDNPTMQPSTVEKFISGIWDNVFSSMKIDPTEVIQSWQAIEGNGSPKLLTEADSELCTREGLGAFGRMNILTRKISQASRTCRSLEVLVQANWMQCFDDRAAELGMKLSKEKAKKKTLDEACVDFQWTEKELRNKMGIWRGYHDIQKAGGWVALVFAGMGLYRFCKYRVSFSEDTFRTLKALRHRFEVAADTLHPRWRALLAIVGEPTCPRYSGHPHDWVVCGPNNDPIPLAETYAQWDKNWSYTHLDHSVIDEDAWGLYDPRVVLSAADPASHTCQNCEQHQSDDPQLNSCVCFPNLYGSAFAGSVAVQVFRTPNGKNNGLVACCSFERGIAIGEFVGEVTSGVTNLDVMVGQTERACYQIFQGKQGNHTRFVNHSCQPNAQFERFVWLGTQRVVLVSKGIVAGEEITSDYSDTYWRVSDPVGIAEISRTDDNSIWTRNAYAENRDVDTVTGPCPSHLYLIELDEPA